MTPAQWDLWTRGSTIRRAGYAGFKRDVAVAVLRDLICRRMEYVRRGGARFSVAVQNARLVANAERY